MEYVVMITRKDRRSSRKQSYEKLADSGNPRDGGAQYGYVPFDTAEEVTTEVLRQTVDEINLASVISAINRLEFKPTVPSHDNVGVVVPRFGKIVKVGRAYWIVAPDSTEAIAWDAEMIDAIVNETP